MAAPVFVLVIVSAYLLGSIPFGWLIVRHRQSVDVRQLGSGNIGATNVRRVAGNGPGLLTLLADMAKGTVPVVMAAILAPMTGMASDWLVTAAALAAFAGHLFPIYFGFRTGGKGVATAAGCFLPIAPLSVAAGLAAFAAGTGLSRRVSVGSLTAAVILPFGVALECGATIPALGASAVSLLIWFRHRGNIRRLVNGTEPSLRHRE